MDRNKILKIIFIVMAIIFLFILIKLPKTNCQVCEIEYKSKILDGYEAWKAFEDACISYDTPWDNNISNFSSNKKFFYVNLSDINTTYNDNGTMVISFPDEYLE